MQLSDKTLSILANFSKFNTGFLFLPGQVQKTTNAGKNVFATASVDEDFPVEAPIYNLSELLSALSLFTNPELDFEDDHVLISDNSGQSIRYAYSKKDLITYPEKDIKAPAADVEFELSSANLEKVLNAARVLSLPNISLIRKDNQLILRAQDAANSNGTNFDVRLSSVDGDDFEVHFKVDNLRFLELDYNVQVNLRGIAIFKNESFGIQYAAALVVGSK